MLFNHLLIYEMVARRIKEEKQNGIQPMSKLAIFFDDIVVLAVMVSYYKASDFILRRRHISLIGDSERERIRKKASEMGISVRRYCKIVQEDIEAIARKCKKEGGEMENRKAAVGDLIGVEVGGNAPEYMTIVDLSQDGQVERVRDAEGIIWDHPRIKEK